MSTSCTQRKYICALRFFYAASTHVNTLHVQDSCAQMPVPIAKWRCYCSGKLQMFYICIQQIYSFPLLKKEAVYLNKCKQICCTDILKEIIETFLGSLTLHLVLKL